MKLDDLWRRLGAEREQRRSTDGAGATPRSPSSISHEPGRTPEPSLAGDRSGNAAIVFALCLVPMVGAVGLGVDYWRGLSYKSRLDAAADSAAIGAITAAQTYYNANVQTVSDPALTTNATAAGQAQGYKVFPTNAGAAVAATSAVPQVSVNRSGQTFTSTVTYQATMPMSFGKMFGTPTMAVGGKAGSSLTMGSYIDFYLMLDVSGSMGLPTSDAGQTALAAVNPDNRSTYPNGCVFACHFPGNGGYAAARSANPPIKLRVDSVASAVSNLINTATNTQTLPNQYRIGVYPFIVHIMQAAALSATYTSAKTVVSSFADTYLDSGLSNSATTSMGSGGTHFENILPDMQNYLKNIGNGSSPQSPKPFLFIVTDGGDDNQIYYGNNSWTGAQPQEPNNFGYCQYAQSIGITVSILYIPYIPIQNPVSSFAGDEDDRMNAVIPKIPNDLRNCASPGFFFTANTDADINNAMQAMFAQALQAARITY